MASHFFPFDFGLTAAAAPAHGGFRLSVLALACMANAPVLANEVSKDAANDTATITVTAQRPLSEGLSALGAVPARELPMSSAAFGSQALSSAGVQRLADITKLDASTSDSYNAVGYWDFLSVRGYTLDNRYNYRREGLPISAETSIPLDNKAGVEILKGTSGVQAGTSAPGGLVNYSVKRPTAQDLRTFSTTHSTRGGVSVALDWGGRMPSNAALGYRFNVAHEEMRPELAHAKGQRSMAALALQAQLNRDSTLDFEVETSKRVQPTQQAFSLFGTVLAKPANPQLNLNNQSWTQPVVMRATTATLRQTQQLGRDWTLTSQLGTQQLRTDDRLAYGYGCSAASSYDRFCADGTYDVYDYRSDGEKRHIHSAQMVATGQINAWGWQHALQLGVMRSQRLERYGMQAYNWVGTALGNGSTPLPADPAQTYAPSNRNERNTEWWLSNSASKGAWRLTAGLRVTNLQRQSQAVDGSSAVTGYSQSFDAPSLAVSYRFPQALLYASAGHGVESFVVPDKAGYALRGQPLPAVRSKQAELGLRRSAPATAGQLDWSAALFHIKRPSLLDNGTNYQTDGEAEHKGLEAQAQQNLASTWGQWRWQAAGMVLDAQRTGAVLDSSVNGKAPINVPNHTLRAGLGFTPAAAKAWTGDVAWVREGQRAVTADNRIQLPTWNRYDMALTYRSASHGKNSSVRLSVDNVMNTRYWRESPYQFAHHYLYPGAGRTWRMAYTQAF